MPMADTFELVALGLPADLAPDSLPDPVKRLVADCWPGMSRAQLARVPAGMRFIPRCAPWWTAGAPGRWVKPVTSV
ncbi:hypothetical protein [Paraburkholderia sp. D1E]|uniref:hypothetical protein n=1 Tax=Paraburkholderia sp. D1E TaxID=3461398 RepID=UPI004045DC06